MNDSPIARLLKRLPNEVAKQKRNDINDDLKKIDMLEHFRQTVLRDRFDISRTQPRVMQILMKHLGLSMDFFTTMDAAQREQEIARIVKEHFIAIVETPVA